MTTCQGSWPAPALDDEEEPRPLSMESTTSSGDTGRYVPFPENVEIVRRGLKIVSTAIRDHEFSMEEARQILDPDVRLDVSRRVFNPHVYEGIDGLRQMIEGIWEIWEEFEAPSFTPRAMTSRTRSPMPRRRWRSMSRACARTAARLSSA